MGPKSRRVPPELRQRTEHSCDRCKSRKQKCLTAPGEEKCRHCQKYGYNCVVTKPRKQRLYGSVEMHSAKVSILESLVQGLVPEADLTNVESMQTLAQSLGIPLPDTASPTDIRSAPARKDPKGDDPETLVHDLQGQDQYIGRASSYFFQMKLRSLVGKDPGRLLGQMFLFGPNPTNDRRRSRTFSVADAGHDNLDMSSIASVGSPESLSTNNNIHLEQAIVFPLVRIFFDRINADFPVLHEATFLETLDSWCKSPDTVDRVWLCSFLCVLILARRLCDAPIPEELEDAWWSRIQSLLSTVMFTSSLASVQALMLAALHLHNTSARDICWTLTGAAVRIGFAIGLHRDDLKTNNTPLVRELRKRVWWTLYSFEQLQVSSHDRPSAIDSSKLLPSSPSDAILDFGRQNIPDFAAASNRLVILLGAACRTLPDAAKYGYSGPLSPAAGLLRDLSRWRAGLPQNLSMTSIETQAPSLQRPLCLLHIQYHYVVFLLSRYALLSRFTSVSKDRSNTFSAPLTSMSDLCNESGRLACQLLLKLDSIGQFNAVVWWDVYYLYSSTLVLVLSIVCYISEGKENAASDSRQILHLCTELAFKHLKNPLVPGTMSRWLVVVSELEEMVADFMRKRDNKQSVSSSVSIMPRLSRISANDPASLPTLAVPDREANRLPASSVINRRMEALAEAFKTSDLSEPSPRPGLFVPNLGSTESYDQHFPLSVEPSDPRYWTELHWDGIGDMLMGMETRPWGIQ